MKDQVFYCVGYGGYDCSQISAYDNHDAYAHTIAGKIGFVGLPINGLGAKFEYAFDDIEKAKEFYDFLEEDGFNEIRFGKFRTSLEQLSLTNCEDEFWRKEPDRVSEEA